MNVPYGITAESSVLPGKPLPEQEQCFYCGFWYPKPVSYHHSSSECHEHGDREMNEQRDREKDEHYQLRLVARIVDLEEQLEVLQRARITNVSDVMRENEALRKAREEAQDYAQDYAYKIAYLLRHFDYPEFTFPDGETWEAAMKETGK